VTEVEQAHARLVWLLPKLSDGKLDYNSGLISADLKEFVDNMIVPILA
jgi:hypothetical protein